MKISKEVKAGLIAILAIVGFIMIFQFMKGKSIFSTDDNYYVKYENVEGLAKSSPVSINGLKVGQVEEIKPIARNGGSIYFVVKISVNKDFLFSKNSKVEIFEPGFMTGKEARINLAKDQLYAKSGDTLKGAYQHSIMKSLTSQIGPVKDKLEAVLLGLDSAVVNTNKIIDIENRREIKLLLKNLNTTVEAFKLTSQNASKLLAGSEGKLNNVLDNANKTMITANQAVGKYGKVAESINTQQLDEVITKFSETSVKLDKIITGVEAGQGSLGKLAKDEELYNNLNKSAASLNALIEDLKVNPKRYINISVFGKSSK
ncbi:MCE family protein [Elizabethkingia argentiflava]|uniref:MCE family protein n=1 Tax=Elizabethkingia argenteiflava TaxID=2681556 RepID=A0A845Q0Q0_9FLAO|nr:MlaD family protein [Elizabethkingia argenteiflava]NAW52218.1 MCE family protein [Elizabethkingia argenteiflava]